MATSAPVILASLEQTVKQVPCFFAFVFVMLKVTFSIVLSNLISFFKN